MTTHAVAFLRITEPASLNAYREKAGAALAVHGGEIVQVTPEPAVLEGHPVQPDVMALLRFPDRASAQAWIDDPDLTDTHALRRGAGSSDILVF